MLTRKMLVASAMLAAGALYAQDIELETTESWGNPKNVKVVDGNILEMTGRTELRSSTVFEVDPAKTYKISGELRQTAGEATRTYVGFVTLDEKKRNISAWNFNAIPGTDTELVEELKPTDTTLKVKDASKWEKRTKYSRIMLGVADDYSDLPNFNYIAYEITDVKKDGDVWIATLDKPAKKAAKAGTKIRLHNSGGYMYTGGSHATKAGDDWKQFSGSIKGHGKYGYSAYKAWPPGTAYAQVLILANWNSGKSPDVLQLKDVKLEVID